MNLKSVIIFFLILLNTNSYSQGKDSLKSVGSVTDSLNNDSLKTEKLNETEKLILKQSDQQLLDSIVKSDLKKEIEINSENETKRIQLEQKLKQLETDDSINHALQRPKIQAMKKTAKGFPVIPFKDTVMVIYTRIGSSKPSERAKAITQRIVKLYDKDFFDKDSLKMVRNESGFDVIYKDEIIITITELDAQWFETSAEELSNRYLTQIREAVVKEKEVKSFANIMRRIIYALLTIIIVTLLMKLINRLFRKSAQLITASRSKYFSGIKINNVNLLNPDQHKRFYLRVNNVLKFIVKLAALYFALPLIFSIFPSTKEYADVLLDWVISPAKDIIDSIFKFLPNLFTIIVILVFFHYAIKMLKYFADEIASGNIKIAGFYQDWTNPTFNILKFILYAFMLVLIFPYLPGSDSAAFQGVSVFLGLLLSFGSTSAITNLIAGFVITYMRPFRIGDTIRIGDVTGIVMEKTMLVIRIKTIKNEDVTVPNSTVLSSHTVNYSTNAANTGLIIHSTVTIGYDVPWKKMHEALINAALRTESILKEPKPFVLQTSLDDFYVSYQINGYTHDANRQAVIYSNLHINIQDCCNEAGIEIMSPHYRNMRDGNMTTIPADYLSKDYEPPAFNVKNIGDGKKAEK
ncbi:MAG: mechanosensitive ion channel family protein [Ignavibacteria bacterium]|nr:mechanosensitive ion channel family protein [Ignavibacteria bacterium]